MINLYSLSLYTIQIMCVSENNLNLSLKIIDELKMIQR